MKRLFLVLSVLVVSVWVAAQTEVIAPNENLVVERIPKIPGSLANDIRAERDLG